MRGLLAAFACLCVAATWPPVSAQQTPPQQTPTFRSGIALVTIDVAIHDSSGKPVPGLAAEDLEIKLNGKVQPIRALAFVQASRTETAAASTPPVSTPRPSPPAETVPFDPAIRRTIDNSSGIVMTPGAAAPAASAAPAPPAESRVFVLLVDDLSFAPLRGKAMFIAAQRFLDRLPPSDPVGFTTTSGVGAVNPTTDRAVIKAALARVVGQFSDPRGIGKTGSAEGMGAGPDSPLGISESLDIERGDISMLKDVIIRECYNGNRAIFNNISLEQALAEYCPGEVQRQARQVAGLTRQNRGRQIDGVMSVIKAMQTAGGIRHLVLLSDGLPTSREVNELNPLVRAAAQAGVQLSVLLEEPDLSLTDEGRRTMGAESRESPQADPGQARRRREDDALMINGLQTMTEMLGGNFYRVRGAPDTFFDRVIAASSAIYRLGVELPAGARAGDVFTVSASVKRPGLKASANRFTVAVAPPAPDATAPAPAPPAAPRPDVSLDDALKGALNSKTIASNVPIRIAAFVRRSATAQGQVDLSVNVAVPAGVKGPLTTYLGVIDSTGAVRSSRRVFDAPSGSAGYAALFLVPLAPGDYRIRFVAGASPSDIGTIELPVSASLAPMGEFTASDVLTWYVDATNKAQLFALEDVPASTLHASLELYPNRGMTVDPPSVKWTLTRDGNSELVREQEVTAHAGPAFFRADAEFDFAALPAGRYTIRATLMVDGQPAGSKAAVIRK